MTDHADTVEALRARHPGLHPLIFRRSVERASGPGELFDILEGVPDSFPLVWDEAERRWVVTQDLFQVRDLS